MWSVNWRRAGAWRGGRVRCNRMSTLHVEILGCMACKSQRHALTCHCWAGQSGGGTLGGLQRRLNKDNRKVQPTRCFAHMPQTYRMAGSLIARRGGAARRIFALLTIAALVGFGAPAHAVPVTMVVAEDSFSYVGGVSVVGAKRWVRVGSGLGNGVVAGLRVDRSLVRSSSTVASAAFR